MSWLAVVVLVACGVVSLIVGLWALCQLAAGLFPVVRDAILRRRAASR